ncbi:MAG TPA: hypothetical protein VN025_20035 [Candidatus Dormibacteraeota bacterium]|nr:hypothetical protein [Candidatus Dormibacteraeota bacterium]
MFDLLPSFGHLDPRVAVLLLMVLLLGAAIPLALGWTKLLPPEREPFSRPDLPRHRSPRDLFAIFLLVNVSLSLIAAVPRIADALHLDWLVQFLPNSWPEHVGMILLIWLVFVPALAAAYAAVRPNPIRKHLIIGGILVLILWLLSPTLLGSLASVP